MYSYANDTVLRSNTMEPINLNSYSSRLSLSLLLLLWLRLFFKILRFHLFSFINLIPGDIFGFSDQIRMFNSA